MALLVVWVCSSCVCAKATLKAVCIVVIVPRSVMSVVFSTRRTTLRPYLTHSPLLPLASTAPHQNANLQAPRLRPIPRLLPPPSLPPRPSLLLRLFPPLPLLPEQQQQQPARIIRHWSSPRPCSWTPSWAPSWASPSSQVCHSSRLCVCVVEGEVCGCVRGTENGGGKGNAPAYVPARRQKERGWTTTVVAHCQTLINPHTSMP